MLRNTNLLSKKNRLAKYGKNLFRKSVIAKKNPMFLFNPNVPFSSAFYQQLMQFAEVQQMFHFFSLNIEPFSVFDFAWIC